MIGAPDQDGPRIRRLDLALVFDRDRSRRPSGRRLLAELWSLPTCRLAPPAPASLPHGGARPVLVVPAFLTGDAITRGLRRCLDSYGFRTFGWGLGVNIGPTPRLLAGLDARVRQLSREHGPIAVIGVSLGGLLARDAAHNHPAEISHVVTVASPISLPTASPLEPLVRLFARRYSPDLQLARLRLPLPMPSTMIFSRRDGIVAWDSCFLHEPLAQIVEVDGAHLMLATAPATLQAIVMRLAGPQRR